MRPGHERALPDLPSTNGVMRRSSRKAAPNEWDELSARLPFRNIANRAVSPAVSVDSSQHKLSGTVSHSSLVDFQNAFDMEIIASQAVMASKELSILSFDEVEELQKESRVLASRIDGLKARLSTEVKIRDAAFSLSKLHDNRNNKRISRQASEDYDAASRRVDQITKDLQSLENRENATRVRILGHMAGVLGMTVQKMEDNANPPSATMASTLSASSSNPPRSPASVSSSQSTRVTSAKFDGAHLYANHSKSYIPVTRSVFSPTLSLNGFSSPLLQSPVESPAGNMEMERRIRDELERSMQGLRVDKDDLESRIKEVSLQNQILHDRLASLSQEKDAALSSQSQQLDDLLKQVNEAVDEVLTKYNCDHLYRTVKEADNLPAELYSFLDRHLTSTRDERAKLETEIQSLQDQQDTSQRYLQEDMQTSKAEVERWRTEAESHQRDNSDLRASLEDMQKHIEQLEHEAAQARAAEQQAQRELAVIATELEEQQTSFKPLQSIWKSFPPATSSKPILDPDAPISDYLSTFSVERKPIGNFSLDIAAQQPYSLDGFLDRTKTVILHQKLLLDRLHLADREIGDSRATRAQLISTTSELESARHHLQELESRLGEISTREVDTLEKLNDLTEALENARASCKKAEMERNAAVSELENARGDSQRVLELERHVNELTDDLAILDETRAQEQRQKVQLLGELAQLTEEASQLRGQLRRAQRGGAGGILPTRAS